MSIQARKLYTLLGLACVAGYSWLGYSSYFHHEEGPAVCLIKSVTGIPCPSCGSTRSVMALLDGNFMNALLFNPFGIIIMSLMLIIPSLILFDLISGKSLLYNLYCKSEVFIRRKAFAIPAIVLVIVNWVWNIYKDM